MPYTTQPRYIVSIHDLVGRKIASLAGHELIEGARTVGKVGNLNLVYPSTSFAQFSKQTGISNRQLPKELEYWWLVVEREIAGRRRLLYDTAWQILNPGKSFAGGKWYELEAFSVNVMLEYRYVLYDTDSTRSSGSDQADDEMKTIFDENFLTATGPTTNRNVSSTYLSVAADEALGPTIDKAYAWKRVDRVIEEIRAAAAAHDVTQTDLFYDVAVKTTNPLAFEFRTYKGARGVDRGSTSGQAMKFIEGKNLKNSHVVYRRRDEWNYAYAAGQGEGALRDQVSAEDTTRSRKGPFTYREYFKDARQVPLGDAAKLQDEANTALYEGRPQDVYTGEIVDTPSSRWGIHYDFGDKVVAVAEEESFDCWVTTMSVKVDGASGEQSTARLSSTVARGGAPTTVIENLVVRIGEIERQVERLEALEFTVT